MMTNHVDLIARAVRKGGRYWRDKTAKDILAALDVAGLVVVPKDAVAAAKREGMERAAVIVESFHTGIRDNYCPASRKIAAAIRAEKEKL